MNYNPGAGLGGGVGGGLGLKGVEGISRQSTPVNTEIDGAVETGCPY